MGEMSNYYLEQEDPFDPNDTYWGRSQPEPTDNDGPPRIILSPNKIWITKSGEKFLVKDMTNDHLVNSIKYLRKLYGNQLDEEIEDFEESDTVPAFPTMLEEVKKRGLLPKL